MNHDVLGLPAMTADGWLRISRSEFFVSSLTRHAGPLTGERLCPPEPHDTPVRLGPPGRPLCIARPYIALPTLKISFCAVEKSGKATSHCVPAARRGEGVSSPAARGNAEWASGRPRPDRPRWIHG